MRHLLFCGAILSALNFAVLTSLADGPRDNIPDNVRRIPKLGVEPNDEQRQQLIDGLKQLQADIAKLRTSKNALAVRLLPDVEIFYRAAHDALHYQEFFDARDIPVGLNLIEQGRARAAELLAGKAPWTAQTGLVVRGFRSRLDDSVQPYGLIVPDSYSNQGPRFRTDIWFHGRGETLSELRFLQQRQRSKGTYTPPDTIVLHPYGRYSNAFKFAGEIDVLEALEHVRENYRVDDERISVRGFSMGGAACWQFAVHYSSRWFAANPGAGFSETPEFLRFFQKETLRPYWWQKDLWHMHDCTDWAVNLKQLPTVAYSGEVDIQKQAADIMEESLALHGVPLVHIIGPKMGHRIHPASAAEIDERLASLAIRGRDRAPREVHFSTYTLKYNRMNWVLVDGLAEHWKPAEVRAEIANGFSITCKTTNVTDLTLEFPPGYAPFRQAKPVPVSIDGQRLSGPPIMSDRSWTFSYHLLDGRWRAGKRTAAGLRKKHQLQGPIDDAFMDSFLFVKPTGKPLNPVVGKWAAGELERAIEHWRRHFRGYARVKNDSEITEQDIASSNLILWGDPHSNGILKKLQDKLPIEWSEQTISAGKQSYSSANHALIMIYPNPLNADKYIVVNSSFTFRDFAYLNNARQVSKLPDWAIVNLETAPNSLWPGEIKAANFFDESWGLRPPRDVEIVPAHDD